MSQIDEDKAVLPRFYYDRHYYSGNLFSNMIQKSIDEGSDKIIGRWRDSRSSVSGTAFYLQGGTYCSAAGRDRYTQGKFHKILNFSSDNINNFKLLEIKFRKILHFNFKDVYLNET